MATITQALGTSFAHVRGDYLKTSTGDIDRISGLHNLKNRLFKRLITIPGTLIHRPTFGVGVQSYQNALNSFAIQRKLSDLIQSQFELDPGVEAVNSIQFDISDDNPALTKIKISVKPVGYSEQAMTFLPFSEVNS